MGGQPLGEVGNTSLGSRVSRDLGQGSVSIHGRDIQNAAVLLCDHILGKRLRRQQSSLEVQLKDEVNTAGIQIKEGLAAFLSLMLILIIRGSPGIVAAGTVDQNIAGTQILKNSLVSLFQSGRLQNIGLVALADEAFSLQLVCQSLDGILVQVQSSNLGTALCKRTGHSATNQTAGAGNDDDLTGKIDVQGKIDHNKLPPM